MRHLPTHRSARFRVSTSASAAPEALEPRRLFSVSPSALTALGFERIEWEGEHLFAKPGEFILRLDHAAAGAAAGPAARLAGISARLKGLRVLGSSATALRATRLLSDAGESDAVLVKGPATLRAGLFKLAAGALSGYRGAEPNIALFADDAPAPVVPNDPSFASQWALNNTGANGLKEDADIDATEAWARTTGDRAVVVGVIDSGVAYAHSDLAANIWTNPREIAGNGIDDDGNGYVDDIHGWDFFNNDNDPTDDNGHGTHVASTIAAVRDNNTGIAGVATASILPLKFLDASGVGTLDGALAAINYATKLRKTYGVNIRVTNNSWSGSPYIQVLKDAIKASNDAGILFVAAAGNGGSDGIGDDIDAAPDYPAAFDLPGVVSVAATNSNDELAPFSNFGKKSVDLAAPGVSILGARPTGYGYSTGTSMAAPHVVGAAALAWALKPTAAVAEVKAALLNGADSLASLSGKTVSGGRLNALGALNQISPPVVQQAPPPVVQTAAVNGSAGFAGNPSQRSRVTDVTIAFDAAVTLDSGAFTLAGRNGAGAGTSIDWSNPSGDGKSWIVRFSGAGVVGGSLPDGVYDLSIAAAKVHAGAAAGPVMTSDYTFAFHRLFGDGDGDGDSDNTDLFSMRSAYGKSDSDAAYLAYFDYNSDGKIDNADVFQIRSRRIVEFKAY